MTRVARISHLAALVVVVLLVACRGPRPDFTTAAGVSGAAAEAVAETPAPIRSYRCERAGE
ncbi:MAG: hypothetical protein ACKPEA_05345, partial [Planctomycetota bacterium]